MKPSLYISAYENTSLTLLRYISQMMSALSQVPGSDVSPDSVAICAPYFPTGSDKNVGYPWTDGLPAGRGSTSSALVWQGTGWADGNNNQYPYYGKNISSYEALDQLIKYFDDRAIFPDMKQIVVAGHSLGAQTVHRYVAVGNALNTASPVSYYIGNPNSYLWLSIDRPLDTSSCPTYDDWRDGLSNYSASNSYANALFEMGRDAILSRYNGRQVAYGRALRDVCLSHFPPLPSPR